MAKQKPTTKLCKHCKTEIPFQAKVCPNCRRRVKGGKVKWGVLLAILLLGAMILAGGGNQYDDGSAYNPNQLISQEEYSDFFSDVSAYRGRSVDMYGKIFNILDSSDSMVFQMYTDDEMEHSVIVYDSSNTAVKEEEYVLVKGVVTDTYEGENLMGGSVICPLISAHSISESNYIEAFSPATKTVALSDAQWSRDGLKLTIDKVEFAEKETRLYATLENEGKESVSMALYSAKIVQGKKQYELSSNYNADYDELQSDINAGVTDTGILTFPPLKKEDFRLVFSCYGEHYYDEEEISVSISDAGK